MSLFPWSGLTSLQTTTDVTIQWRNLHPSSQYQGESCDRATKPTGMFTFISLNRFLRDWLQTLLVLASTKMVPFLALFYNRVTAIRGHPSFVSRPSVNPVFSEIALQVDTKFCGKVKKKPTDSHPKNSNYSPRQGRVCTKGYTHRGCLYHQRC